MYSYRALILVVCFIGTSTSLAISCLEPSTEVFIAEFKVARIEDARSECRYDEGGKSLEDVVYIPEKGCILRLEIVKIKNGAIPEYYKEVTSLYSIYQTGALCKKKVGDHITKAIRNIGGECCIEWVRAGQHKMQYCKMKPEPRAIVKKTPLLVMCAQKDVNWKVVTPPNDNLPVKSKPVVCKDKKNKVLVYPPNDGFGGSHSQGASGKPTEYCDEDDLMRQKPNLVPKAESN